MDLSLFTRLVVPFPRYVASILFSWIPICCHFFSRPATFQPFLSMLLVDSIHREPSLPFRLWCTSVSAPSSREISVSPWFESVRLPRRLSSVYLRERSRCLGEGTRGSAQRIAAILV